MKRSSGFTLIEMIVVLAIIVALAGILVPVVRNELEDSKKAKAQATVNRIATAITQFIKDTSFAPTGKNGRATYHFLYTDGQTPSSNKFASGPGTHLRNFLGQNKLKVTNWRGPYLQDVGSDPWGSRYLVNAQGFFSSSERAWVLSAGPNRKVDTKPNATKPAGDDIAVFVE